MANDSSLRPSFCRRNPFFHQKTTVLKAILASRRSFCYYRHECAFIETELSKESRGGSPQPHPPSRKPLIVAENIVYQFRSA
ncbi:hypothetical protein O9993_02455 [Vibrio lentus]|nr:hypothetical protein [Vibrio lentus]